MVINSKTLVLNSAKGIINIILSIILLSVFIIKFKEMHFSLKSGIFQINITTVISDFIIFSTICKLLWTLFGKIVFEITGDALRIQYNLLALSYTQKFNIEKIQNVKIKNVSAHFEIYGIKLYSSWGFLGYNFIDTDAQVPAICFDYGKQPKTIGKRLNQADLLTLRDWITR